MVRLMRLAWPWRQVGNAALLVASCVACMGYGTRSEEVGTGVSGLHWEDRIPPDAVILDGGAGGQPDLQCFVVSREQNLLPAFVSVERVSGCARSNKITSITLRLGDVDQATSKALVEWLRNQWGSGSGMLLERHQPNEDLPLTVSQYYTWSIPVADDMIVMRRLDLVLVEDSHEGNVGQGDVHYRALLRMSYGPDRSAEGRR